MIGIAGLANTTIEFRAELARMAARLNLDPSYLAAVMEHESGFNPAAVNKFAGATGIIQFMPNTAHALGTSVLDLVQMSAAQQLKYVELFFRPYAAKMRQDVPGDYLMATFMPAFIGQSPETVLFTEGTIGYTQNSGFDHEHKGTITIADVTGDIDKIVAQGRVNPPAYADTTVPPPVPFVAGAAPAPSSPSAPLPQPQPSSGGPFDLPVLRVGSKGNAVELWQRFLKVAGFSLTVTGSFDASTKDATMLFQTRQKIGIDGVVGAQSWGRVLT